MASEHKSQQLVHQEIALDTYLSKLLEDIPTDLILDQEEVKGNESDIKNKPALKDATIEKVDAQPSPVINQQQNSGNKQPEKLVYPLTILPEWALQDFQALFFRVDQLILATPLIELLKTVKIDREPTQIAGQPSWFMGLLDVYEKRVGVLDTGQLIFGKAKGLQRNLEEKPFKRILITLDGKWGLACDEVLSIGKLEPKDIRWRSMRKKRPWLVGTVIDQLTAVIDVKQLVPHRKAKQ